MAELNPEVVRIGVLASGGGTTVEAAQLDILEGRVEGIELAFVICNNGPNNPNAGVWKRMEKLGVTVLHVSNATQEPCTLPKVNGEEVRGTISFEASDEITTIAIERGAKMLSGLGLMKKVIGSALELFSITNNHPGPLGPELFTAGVYGSDVQKLALRKGLTHSGPTMHWMDKTVDENGLPAYDTGPEIGHAPVEITQQMLEQWYRWGSVERLQAEVQRVERQMTAQWLYEASRQII